MVRFAVVSTVLLLIAPVRAEEVAVGKPVGLGAANVEMPLVGSGTRRKFGLVLYDAALYSPEPASKGGDALLETDGPITVRLAVRSRLFTKPRLQRMVASAIGDAGAEVTRGVDHMFDAIDAKIEKGDVVEFAYTSESGTTLRVNGRTKAAVAGTGFRRALFGIWIGDRAVDDDLAESLVPRPATP